ncbi:hypothetical protein BpHYR1_018438 [Brachionus plicatilis]|uniref:Uncharacterized protein n=1 Tax=Brachionus plicatilis TaxID=10195 RepID=A0A3M7QP88_BRAPC|nr:hypothetical protein BpHYR1_018438 [Brachionus plicatilis]
MEMIWTAKHVKIELKVHIFEASVLSILLYECELWIITRDDTKMHFLESFYKIYNYLNNIIKFKIKIVLKLKKKFLITVTVYCQRLSLSHIIEITESRFNTFLPLNKKKSEVLADGKMIDDFETIEKRWLNKNSYFLYLIRWMWQFILFKNIYIQKLNSNLIFIRNATYSNIGSNMHVRFHHYEMKSSHIMLHAIKNFLM